MRKIIVLLWVILLPITSLIAQTDEGKQEAYNQLKEWAVVKLTIAYMEDLKGWDSNTKGINTNEFGTYKKLVNDFQIFSIEKKIILEEVGQSLEKGDWKSTKNNVFLPYIIFINDSINDYNFNQIKAYGYSEKVLKDNFFLAKKNIFGKYQELLNEKITNEESSILAENEIENTQVESFQNIRIDEASIEKLSVSSFWLYGFLGLMLLVVILVLKLISENKKLKRRLNNSKNKSKIKSSNNQLASPKTKRIEEENHNLREEIEKLIEKIESLKKQLGNLEYNPVSPAEHSTSNVIIETHSHSINLEVPQQNIRNLIYLSSPFQNLTFANEDARKDKNSNSLYQVDFNEQMQTGYLTILVDADLSKALNSPDTYLETACTYENEYFNNARAIKIIEKGEIKLDGEDWIVIKKVRIKFI